MPHRVLVFCGDHYHPANVVKTGLAPMADAFEFLQAPDGPVQELPADLAGIVIAKSNNRSPAEPTPWADTRSDALIQQFVESGKGLMVVHSGTVGYPASTSVRQMTGGAFVRHPEACEVMLEPAAGHPIAAGVGSFTVHDEHYMMDFDDGQDIFMHSRSLHGIQPAGWRKRVGSGRVCVLTPGHFADVWAHSAFQAVLRNGLGWLASG